MKLDGFALARALGRRLPQPLVRRLQRSNWYLRRHYCQALSSFDPAEEPELEVVSSLLRHGDLAIDVGANIGVYTRFMSLGVGSSGCVWSLEPVPFTHSILAHNVRALGLRNVQLFACAATESDGSVHMEVPRAESGHLNIYLARIGAPGGAGETVPVESLGRSLDSLVADRGGRPAFVKVDVEGHEAACLRGAKRLLREFRPALLIELSSDPDSPGTDASDVVRALAGLGYSDLSWDGSCLKERRPGDRQVNHFFLQPWHCDLLREKGMSLR